MVYTIVISSQKDIKNTIEKLNHMKKHLPIVTREGMRRWGAILERDMKMSARLAGIQNFTGTLQGSGIRYEQRGDTGYLFIRLYGIYQDSMTPHFVNVTRSRTKLLAWAKQSRSPAISGRAQMVSSGAIKKFSIFVKPHPFIDRGYNRAIPKLRPVLKRAIGLN